MSRPFYRLTRDLHLYAGLFISPFVLLFSITVFFFVHGWFPATGSKASTTRVVRDLALPQNLESLSGRPLIDALKPTLEKAGVRGEIGFVRHDVKEQKLIIPVTIPGRQITMSLLLASREAIIVSRETGFADALVTLHKSPGQHVGEIGKNWFYMKAWAWLADATVYLFLFVSVTGIYLWYVLRAERRVGYVLLMAGALTFFGMAYVLSH